MADDYEIVENGTDDMDVVRDPLASVRDAMASIDAQRNALKAQKEFGFDESSFGYNVYENKEIETYGLAEQRKDNLKNVIISSPNNKPISISRDIIVYPLLSLI